MTHSRTPVPPSPRTPPGPAPAYAGPRRHRVPRVLAATALTAAALAAAPGGAHAVDQSKGHAGFCKNSTGVTVVVDFQDLGGTTIVRCYPGSAPGTGLDALKGAGFQIEGVQRWGESFICRVENRPSATEGIPVRGNEGYRERCIDTPPAAAYWSYWHAGNNCAWEYSQWGVKNRDFVPGGFEGWSFSLNASADSNPEPRIAAVRPGTGNRPCNAPDEPPPKSNNPGEQQPGLGGGSGGSGGSAADGGASGGGTDGGTGGATGGGTDPGGAGAPGGSAEDPGGTGDGTGARDENGKALPPPRPRDGAGPSAEDGTARDPGDNVKFTGGEDARDVTEAIREESGASDLAPWAAAGALVVLAAATWVTARRRRRAREG
ncbi:hypothetical protein O7599_15290 [Streptomyces sp. WMMC500]|uniref:hypothetical protein n=1 Tax=Streptomyces sp. WMMC500 TaxID=3015154 RepID=UPI00248C67D2|nr:hypothetical protein [Streptomyces sp. WMMC500]WBB63797.1 hypothetical protein O7599_15290 [Streptomyces sp. WMMC500]